MYSEPSQTSKVEVFPKTVKVALPSTIFAKSSILDCVLRCLDLKIFKFLSWHFIVVRLISKFMMSQPGKQIIVIHILPNISRCKGFLAMKFCQLLEYSMKNIFLEKLLTKCEGNTIPRLTKIKTEQITGSIVQSFI